MLTYHVVPRFDIAAEGGPLALGTVVADLETLVPLNGGPFHLEMPKDLPYPPVTHSDFKDELKTARRLNIKAWAKFLGLPLSASAGIENSKELEQGVECESVTTTYFDDPMGTRYIKQCLDVAPIHEWLGYQGNAADLYVVMGLKVAKNLKFNKAGEKKTHADVAVSGKELHTQTEAGLKAEQTKEEKKKLGFSAVSQDIVIGYRVKRYHCTRKWFRKDWTKKDAGILEGNMQSYGGSKVEGQKPVLEVEPAVIDSEAAAQAAAPEGASECWVGIDG